MAYPQLLEKHIFLGYSRFEVTRASARSVRVLRFSLIIQGWKRYPFILTGATSITLS